MKLASLPGLLGCLVFLSSCSSNDNVVFCPPLSAPSEGARAFILTDKHLQIVDVRLNGVRAQCTAEANGDVLMEVKAGLKMTRNLAENAESDIVVVQMMTAILDVDDQVVFNDRFGYKNGFDTDLEFVKIVILQNFYMVQTAF